MSGKPFHEPTTALELARNPDTQAADLRLLAQTPWSFVQAAVARHPNTEPTVLQALVPNDLGKPHDSQDLAIALASNPLTPVEALMRLASLAIPLLNSPRYYSGVFETGVRLCQNPAVPFEIIQRLLTAPAASTIFWKVVARESRRNDVLFFLLKDRNERVRNTARQTLGIIAVR